MCLLLQDPWQDCDEDPWQLSSRYGAPDTFSDPWQDAEDPWQPFVAETAKITGKEVSADPWQPVISQLVKTSSAAAASDSIDDPWQPAFADPWQDGADDPWQLP
jgi:hypothetical protein